MKALATLIIAAALALAGCHGTSQADYPGMAEDYYTETQGARRLLLK